MEELPEKMSGEGISFASQQKLPSYTKGKWENLSLSRSTKHSAIESNPFSSIYNQSLDTSNNPTHAMEFLCRSWSSPASEIQQMFKSTAEEDEESKAWETLENKARSSIYQTNKVDNKWMDFNRLKRLINGKSLSNCFTSLSNKKKENFRLQTANLHAALSLTQLAASIAGFATNGLTKASSSAWDQDMSVVVASAAALLTTVHAEVAESLGAKRSRVSFAVESGLAAQTPIDTITLTATAATCLRGVATLKSRRKADKNLPGTRDNEHLTASDEILVVMPSDKIIDAGGKNKDIQGSHFVNLKTSKGVIKLLFEDEKQSVIWVSTISNLLQMLNSC
ncbi:hypothetical protein NMG60_11020006 [Bertholletia excelsa]